MDGLLELRAPWARAGASVPSEVGRLFLAAFRLRARQRLLVASFCQRLARRRAMALPGRAALRLAACLTTPYAVRLWGDRRGLFALVALRAVTNRVSRAVRVWSRFSRDCGA